MKQKNESNPFERRAVQNMSNLIRTHWAFSRSNYVLFPIYLSIVSDHIRVDI